MICLRCSTELSQGSKFCKECGAKIVLTCPNCGKTLSPDSKFCPECGQELSRPVRPKEIPKIDYQQPQSYTPRHLAKKILTTRSAIEGERKIVTVMFADVDGFSSISEKLDPEDVHAVMDGCFKILMDEIHRYEGSINQFTGDGVMALFGAPIAHEDHAQRACFSALAIQKVLVPYGNKLKQDFSIAFKMRIGLNSGPVVVGAIGDDLRMDYTAQGDTANLASRMESMAQPGTVQAAAATYRLVKDAFEFEPLGEVSVKGKKKPVAVYRLKDKAFKTRARSEREVYSEMVGRDQELARIELQILKAVNGEGSVVNVVGEAGIGKSRLMVELQKREVVKRVMLLEGRAISMGRNLSFHPIIDLLKNWARIREDDGESAAMNKLQEAIRRVSVEESDEIFPFVATLMGMKLSGKYAERIKGIEGEALEKLIFKNVRELLIRSTEIIPTVIVIEDLHWADTSSLIMIDALYRLARNQKVVFINVFRPGYWENEDKTPANLKDRMTDLFLAEIVLQPLDVQSSETLINNMLSIKGLHLGVKTRIIERAGGNPFFIEEVVRGLIDEGAVVVKDGGFEVTDKIHSVVIPPTIRDVLMARIDRLDEESRNVIKVASVIGRSFFYRILADVISCRDGLDDKLEFLKQIQLIRERVQMNELEYLFKHALAQEAAYESTLLQQRKALHMKVAESIERMFSERLHEFYGILALHYSRAENLEKAEKWLIKAGEEAQRSSASNEALFFFQGALRFYLEKKNITSDWEIVALLEMNIAFALLNKARYLESVEYAYSAMHHLEAEVVRYQARNIHLIVFNWIGALRAIYFPCREFKNDPNHHDNNVCKTLFNLGMALAVPNPRAYLISALPVAIKFCNKYNPRKLESGMLLYLAMACSFPWLGLFSIGKRMLCNIRDKINFNNPVEKLFFTSTEYHINFLQGADWENGDREFGYDENLINRNIELGQLWWASMMLQYYAWKKVEQGNFQGCEKIVEKLERFAIQYDHPQMMVMKHESSARKNLKMGLLKETIEEATKGIESSKRTDVTLMMVSMISLKTSALALLGQINEAIETIEAAHRINAQTDIIPYHLGDLFTAQALIDIERLSQAIKEGNRTDQSRMNRQAGKSVKRCLKNAKKAACHLTETLRLKGLYYSLIGKEKKAFAWWFQAIWEGERLGALPDLSRTYMEVGKFLLKPQSKFKELNGISAPEYLSKAETLFREMDLQWDMEQLEQVREKFI